MSDPIELTLNKAVPNFTAACTQGTENGVFSLSEQRGSKVILYFYPKDSTPGCTTQGQNFRDLHSEFLAANTKIFGISRDSLKSHHNFKTKMAFPFELIADTDEAICTLFDVMKLKNMYGKQVRGIERSTFVLDEEGVVRRAWRGVKVPGHVVEVLEFVQQL